MLVEEGSERRLSWLISLELWVSKVGVLKLYFLICCGILFAKRFRFFFGSFLARPLAAPLSTKKKEEKSKGKENSPQLTNCL